MMATMWCGRLAVQLAAELHALACEEIAVELDGGLATAAISAITAVPAGARRDYEIAMWAHRIATGPRRLAVVIDDAFGAAELEALGRLYLGIAEIGIAEIGGGS